MVGPEEGMSKLGHINQHRRDNALSDAASQTGRWWLGEESVESRCPGRGEARCTLSPRRCFLLCSASAWGNLWLKNKLVFCNF